MASTLELAIAKLTDIGNRLQDDKIKKVEAEKLALEMEKVMESAFSSIDKESEDFKNALDEISADIGCLSVYEVISNSRTFVAPEPIISETLEYYNQERTVLAGGKISINTAGALYSPVMYWQYMFAEEPYVLKHLPVFLVKILKIINNRIPAETES